MNAIYITPNGKATPCAIKASILRLVERKGVSLPAPIPAARIIAAKGGK